MKTRDKILYIFLIIVGLASVFGGGIDRGIINILFGAGVNVVIWYVFIKLAFWIFDKIKKK